MAAWDAWAAYDSPGSPVHLDASIVEIPEGDEARADAQVTAVAHASWQVARTRYTQAVDGELSVAELDELAASMCLSATPPPSSPGAVGLAAAEAVLAATADDGANEADGYAGSYEPANPPLVVSRPGAELADVARWQPLQFEQMVTQNGIPLDTTVQEYVGPHWGSVASFALPPAGTDGMPLDPGPPPAPAQPAFREGVVAVLDASSRLDPRRTGDIDIGPGAVGNAPLGSDDGDGHPHNPATGEPYAPQVVVEADYRRVIAEFWADGPTSETPPGHWFSVAHLADDQRPAADRRIAGVGPVVDQLEWDVKQHLVLGAALHDAAVAAWGSKAVYDYVRPVSLVRHLGGLGQSSDPDGPAYHADGLPLVEGLVEVVTATSSASGERHEHLADHVGEVAVLAWAREPAFFGEDLPPVRWIRAVEWLPYQMATFVTPAFAAYVSGHSTFSRAAAEALTSFTGDPYFPGGMLAVPIDGDFLRFEEGPSAPFELQWATYRDAADEAGRSRISGGIHVPADDLAGRRLGAEVGERVWDRVVELFGAISSG